MKSFLPTVEAARNAGELTSLKGRAHSQLQIWWIHNPVPSPTVLNISKGHILAL